jgi:multicomponent Na+:H+ antiporter subunit B
VIMAAGFILYGLVFGLADMKRMLPPRWVEVFSALGVLLYGGVGVYAMFSNGEFLDYNALDPHNTIHGQHRGIFWVELGVGMTVVSVMVGLFYAFAGRGKRRE